MKKIAAELEKLIDTHLPALQKLSEKDCSLKPNPAKWSKKEILGHTIDSAQNNIRRFVVAQYEESLIVYNQDKWVAIAGYQAYEMENLIRLWELLNRHACKILNGISEEGAQRICNTPEPKTVEWLAIDYIKHLRHHLHQVLDLEPVPYP